MHETSVTHILYISVLLYLLSTLILVNKRSEYFILKKQQRLFI